MRLRPLLLAPLAALALAACGDDPVEVPRGLGLPLAGRFSGALTDDVRVDTITILAGRAGRTSVQVCGPAGMDFDIRIVGVGPRATPSNCERITFDARGGRPYQVIVTAPDGTAGPFSGCWSGGFVTCETTIPLVSDPNVPAGYYAAAAGLTGQALIDALNDIIDNQRVLGYDRARDSMYAFVDDPDNDDQVIDLYVGRSARVNSRQTALLADFNAEHSWPQSRGANEDPAQSDLHIIFPADEGANSARLNHPFGRVTGQVLWESPAVGGQAERSRLGRDANNRIVFEPRDSKKGDVARAILYFYVRYKGDPTPSFSLANFNVEEATLIQWAQQDPPDDYERARNNLVYRAQGNRNPFVDRPAFVTEIGDFPNARIAYR